MTDRPTVVAGSQQAILTIEHETESAILLSSDTGNQAWLPKSQIRRRGSTIVVSDWLASKFREDQQALFSGPTPRKPGDICQDRFGDGEYVDGEYYQ